MASQDTKKQACISKRVKQWRGFFLVFAATLTSIRGEWETVVRLNGRYREPPGGIGAFVDGWSVTILPIEPPASSMRSQTGSTLHPSGN